MKKNPFEEVETSVREEKNEPKEIQKAEIFSALRNSNNPVHIKKISNLRSQSILFLN